jgi:hypothetical protein
VAGATTFFPGSITTNGPTGLTGSMAALGNTFTRTGPATLSKSSVSILVSNLSTHTMKV